MVAISSTSNTTHRTREMRRRQAGYSARHREKTAGIPESRVLDRALVEALGVHLQSLPAAQLEELTMTILRLAKDGLVYAGYEKAAARTAVAKRLRYLVSNSSQGVVRTAKLRATVARPDLTP